jgi:hypothetical protein
MRLLGAGPSRLARGLLGISAAVILQAAVTFVAVTVLADAGVPRVASVVLAAALGLAAAACALLGSSRRRAALRPA